MNKKDIKEMKELSKKMLEITEIDDIIELKNEIIGLRVYVENKINGV